MMGNRSEYSPALSFRSIRFSILVSLFVLVEVYLVGREILNEGCSRVEKADRIRRASIGLGKSTHTLTIEQNLMEKERRLSQTFERRRSVRGE